MVSLKQMATKGPFFKRIFWKFDLLTLGPFKIGPFEDRLIENWTFLKLDLLRIGPFEIGYFEIWLFENWTFWKLDLLKLDILKLDLMKIGPFEIGYFEIGYFEIGPFENWTFCSHYFSLKRLLMSLNIQRLSFSFKIC